MLCLSHAKKTLSSRTTVAICVSMARVGGNRRLLSEGTGFLAISDILFSPSFHLGGAPIVICPIDWHNVLGGTGTVHRGNRDEFRGQASIRRRSWRGRNNVRRVSEQGDACSVHTRGGLSYLKKKWAGLSSLSLVGIDYLGSAVWNIAWLALSG